MMQVTNSLDVTRRRRRKRRYKYVGYASQIIFGSRRLVETGENKGTEGR
jgi:hypothetical protein